MVNSGASTGQIEQVWTDWWKGITPEAEIRMWDFYGGRQWISKYVPRFGKTIEAGCGLGRYNFYFAKFGIDIEGVDFSKETISFLQLWQKKYGLDCSFKVGDVCNLDYADNSLSGYISLGVVEHFIEGPGKPISEAYRVLRPGGIAIITTPNRSWLIRKSEIMRKLKLSIKKIIGRKIVHPIFFQYEYDAKTLAKAVNDAGFTVTHYGNCDFLYTFYEYGHFKGQNIGHGSFAYRVSHWLENTFFSFFAAQSITISVKMADKMFCFLCNSLEAEPESLLKYDVPICKNCQKNELEKFYKKNIHPVYSKNYIVDPPVSNPTNENCDFCYKAYRTDLLFESFGFDKKVCGDCLKVAEINIKLCSENIQPVWRHRVSK